MNVEIDTPNLKYKVRGKNCRIVDKTLATRFGLAFNGSLECDELTIEQKERGGEKND
jgi:hypothetical protein